MPLTAFGVKNALARPRAYKIVDGRGLYLLVQPNGSKLWRWNYRHLGRQKTLALGVYPEVSLAEARVKHDTGRRYLAAGQDPADLRRDGRGAADSDSLFKTHAHAWFEARRGPWSESNAKRILARLNQDVIPAIGDSPVDQITPAQVLRVLRSIEDRGAIESARRVRTYIERIFRMAAAAGHLDPQKNPASGLMEALKTPKQGKRRARLKASEVGPFLALLAKYQGQESTQLALKLTMLTWVRTTETRFAMVQEFEGLDSSAPLWRIPAERMKMRAEHLVPLSRQAVVLVKQAMSLLGPRSEFLFPANTVTKVISENTMLYAMYRLGYHGRATIHGFRGTASTWANEAGWNGDWVERQLAHVEADEVRSAYNSAEYLTGRRALLQAWADWIDLERDVALLI